MDYDFTLGANQAKPIDVVGNFVKYKSGTGEIEVTTSSGLKFKLLPGDGQRNMKEFSRLLVRDTSGGANTGVLNTGEGEAFSDRISGSVVAADNKELVSIGVQGFFAEGDTNSIAAQNAMSQLWNPAASGKNLFLTSIRPRIAVAGPQALRLMHSTQTLLSLGGFAGGQPIGLNKKIGGLDSTGIAEIYKMNSATPTAVAGVTATPWLFVQTTANDSPLVTFDEPIMIPPGKGAIFYVTSVFKDVNITYDFYAKPI